MVVTGKKWLYSGKSSCNRANWLCSVKVLVIGLGGCIRLKWLFRGKSGCIRVKVVVFRQSGCI